VLITFTTKNPTGFYRGFQIIITAYKKSPCRGRGVWQCAAGGCISPNLHCDNIAHCSDASDEMINCNNTGFLVPSVAECTLFNTEACPKKPWEETWFYVTLAICIIAVFLVFAICVKVRKMVCGSSYDSPVHIPSFRRSKHSSRPAHAHHPTSATHTVMVHSTLPCNQPQGTQHLLPPPYTPVVAPGHDSLSSTQSNAPGEPPPIYEDSLNYRDYREERFPTNTQRSSLIQPTAPPMPPTLMGASYHRGYPNC